MTEQQLTQTRIGKKLAKMFPNDYIQLNFSTTYSFGKSITAYTVANTPFSIWISSFQQHFISDKSFEDCVNKIKEHQKGLSNGQT